MGGGGERVLYDVIGRVIEYGKLCMLGVYKGGVRIGV